MKNQIEGKIIHILIYQIRVFKLFSSNELLVVVRVTNSYLNRTQSDEK